MSLSNAIDLVLDRSLVLGYTKIGLGARRLLPGWPADPPPGGLTGKDVLVTGASSGLGVATVEGLARLGATVHLVVRDEAKGAGVRDRLVELLPEADLQLRRCDLADLDDVRRFAAEVAADLPRLHGIVHNAGVMPPQRTTSPQGHELSMAVHVLGPTLMTELLREHLAAAGDARVVLVSSGGAYGQRLPASDPEYLRGDYKPATAYARSKRMQLELLPLLAARWAVDGVDLAAMHPGWADTPGVQESLPLFRTLTGPLLRDDAGGADTSVWLIGAQPAPPTGRFWHDRRERPTSLLARTRPRPQDVDRAWSWLESATGI